MRGGFYRRWYIFSIVFREKDLKSVILQVLLILPSYFGKTDMFCKITQQFLYRIIPNISKITVIIYLVPISNLVIGGSVLAFVRSQTVALSCPGAV